jgi:hypothetical protein
MKKHIYTFLLFLFSLHIFSQSDTLELEGLKYDLIAKINNQAVDFDVALSSLETMSKSQYDIMSTQLLSVGKSLKENQLITESLANKLMSSESKVKSLVILITKLENQLKENLDGLKIQTSQLGVVTTNLSEGLITAKNDVSEIAESSSINANSIDTVNQALSQKQQYGLIFIGLFLILVLAVYTILTKRQNTDTKKLASKQQEILEKQIQDGQQLTDWLSKQSSDSFGKSVSGEVDHSFAKRVADEIVRITTNLSRMDTSIKGHKQLSASVRKLEQSLNSNGYELEALINKIYDNGMNLQANFVIDENLKEGESIITRIIKPQINYKGKLIQAAQVEVSQGE